MLFIKKNKSVFDENELSVRFVENCIFNEKKLKMMKVKAVIVSVIQIITLNAVALTLLFSKLII